MLSMIIVIILVVLLLLVIGLEAMNQPKKRRLMKSRKSQRKFKAIFKPWTKREVKKDLKRMEALDADE